MGKFSKGILGPFSGKIGTVIGATWRGIDYMRSLPKKSSKAATQLQLNNQFKFKMVQQFLKPMKRLIKVGYQSYKGRLTPMNVATAQLLNDAITGIAPNFSIDFTKVLYSRGDLIGPWNPNVATSIADEITFAWDASPVTPLSKEDDQVSVLVYAPVLQKYVILENAAERSELTFDLQMPAEFAGETVHCYISVVSADGKQVSSSVYIGTALML
jgi:hypothetical protein